MFKCGFAVAYSSKDERNGHQAALMQLWHLPAVFPTAFLFLEAFHAPPTIRAGPWLTPTVDLDPRRQLALMAYPNGRRHVQDDEANHHAGEDPWGIGYTLDYRWGHRSAIRCVPFSRTLDLPRVNRTRAPGKSSRCACHRRKSMEHMSAAFVICYSSLRCRASTARESRRRDTPQYAR
jgi:hypothetical protein